MIYLASNSPRRRELLGGLGIEFEVKIIDGIDESFPENISSIEVAEYIAKKKSAAYEEFVNMSEDESVCVITADTVVVVGNSILGKPKDAEDAANMLSAISGRTHQVVTGVSVVTKQAKRSFSVITDVTFKKLEESEIDYYIKKFKPFDKAGAYGIQEWIGYIGVTRLEGSYFNVMGLPVQRLYEELRDMDVVAF